MCTDSLCLVSRTDLCCREKGIGSTSSLGHHTTNYDSNKTEVLRLILVLLSRQIYVSASSLFTKPSLYSLYLVQKLPRRDVLTILCSLLNTAMNSSTADTMTIATIAGKLPYNHLVFKGEDPQITLITTCLQILCVLLDFQSGTARDLMTDGQPVPSAKTNAFRYFIMKLVNFFSPNGRFLAKFISSIAHKTLNTYSKASWESWSNKHLQLGIHYQGRRSLCRI